MKKIFILLALFISFANCAFSQTNISFVYLNGANTNDEKMTKWFLDGIAKTQKDMVKAFNENEFVKSKLLLNGTRQINEKEIPFYWGDMSKAEIQALHDDIDVHKLFTPHIAQVVRGFFAYCLHDAIWVTKDYNMAPIIRKLHQTVLNEYRNGNSVILFGYSAGSFISAQYLAMKAPYINPKELFLNLNLSSTEKKYTQEHAVKNTCVDALVASKLVVLNNENDLIPNNNPVLFKQNYSKLDSFTQTECIPAGALDGIVNFASPLSLFYSNINTAYFKGNIANVHLIRYLIENNKFFLTVNYAEDPLGFPTTENPRLEQFEAYFGKSIKANDGFLYDKSNEKNSHTFIGAHTSYWATSKKFSKIVTKAYEEGYKHFYKNSASKSLINQTINSTSNKVVTDRETRNSSFDYSFGMQSAENNSP